MTKCKKIGLTGGIASGKTTVSDCFKKLGTQVIDADIISHEVTEPSGSAFEEILSEFGSEILDEKGLINRKKMRAIIFNDPSQKKILENIIHPKVRDEMFQRINKSDDHYLIVSVPLLVETGMHQIMDRNLLVDCSEDTQIERLMHRDKITLNEAKAILKNQASRSDRKKIADDLIVNENNVTLIELENEVLELHKYYSKY
ncbi:MAG: dephospho-CoA kinase [Gammaproteobacteria bacterium]|nr:dephospho-CoA kinase [Gammaproteobacteria bacterium]|tara:strand:- start:260 stop:862 length:603 start_codon:yes stop_codon:yes gene_type:complete